MPQKKKQASTMLKQPQATQQYQVPYTSAKHHATTMGPGAHYNVPYLQQYAPAAPLAQSFCSGAQTISRSSNLHKHYAAAGSQTINPRNFANSQLVYTMPSAYDQPYLSAVTGQQQQQPAMTLAMRAPRERASINTAAAGLHYTIGHAQSRHYLEQLYAQQQRQQVAAAAAATSLVTQHARFGATTSNKPLCRCRVMYLGSSVPHITKNGLHGIQEPLRHLYPEEKFNTNSLRRKSREASTIDISHLSSSLGIDSWLSVWSNGLLLENVDEFGREIKRFFAIESLHYCAAVRFFDTSALSVQQTDTKQSTPVTMPNETIDPNNNNHDDDAIAGRENKQPDAELDAGAKISQDQDQNHKSGGVVRFLPLDAPIFACPGMLDANHPPVFAAIMRRTSGIKVLECHAFICRRDAAANALVRCCTHAYADFLNAKRLSVELGVGAGSAQLQQKLLANGSGTSSYYTGELSTMPGGRDRVPRRHSRSSSASRARDRVRTVNPASGQYQEVEAIVQQHGQPRHAHRPKRPAHSLSTGGTNSQEMTHSEENSLGDEDETNDYAIISRQAHRRDSTTGTKGSSSYLQTRGSRSRRNLVTTTGEVGSSSTLRRRHRERRTKGSSKSLFTDFQPQAQQQVAADERFSHGHGMSRSEELDRLSHSLDHLQKMANAAHSDSTGETSQGAGDQIKYSIVSGKHKRHSKSMQQLLHPPAGPPPPPPPPLLGDFDEPSGGGGGGSLSSARLRRRKAASYQDIFVAPLESAGGSLSRRSSTSRGGHRRQSRRLAGYSRGSSMSSLRVDHEESLRSHRGRMQSENRKYSLELGQANGTSGNYNGIYATCDELAAGLESQPRVLGPDCCVQQQQQPTANTLKRQSKSRRRSEKREHLTLEQQQQQMMAAYCGQAQQPPPPLPPHHAHLGHAYSPQPNASMMVPAPHPLYSTGGYYMQPALHDSPYLATSPHGLVPGTPHLYQQPYLQPAGLGGQFGHLPAGAHHPMFQPATLSAARHTQAPLMTVGRAPKSSKTANGGGTTKSAKSKSQTLATRFRCLSPPVNFFSGNQTQAASDGPQVQLPQQAESQVAVTTLNQSADLNNNNRQSIISTGSSSTLTTTSERISPSQVVSGQPGFLASSAGQPEGAAAGSSGTRAGGKRSSSKLSWIKRLSLTLSGGGGGGPVSASSSQIVSSSPSGHNHHPTDLASGKSGPPPPPAMNGSTTDKVESERENNGRGSLLSDQANSSEQQVQQATVLSANQSTRSKPRAKRAGGLFSGTLTLGRSSKAKTTTAAVAASGQQP